MESSLLENIVRRVVDAARPQRIILFGSAAHGTAGSDSDIDLLVIKPGLTRRRELASRIYEDLIDAGAPVDVVLVTPEEVEAARGRVGSIIGPAIDGGREVYVAADV